MHIDLTDAAKAYGLSYVPEVVLKTSNPLSVLLGYGDPEAAWDPSGNYIAVWPDVFDPPDDYDQNRFASVGVGPLDAKGKAQFIIAHELWHARQDEMYGDDVMKDIARRTRVSTEAHDTDTSEKDADRHAAQAYKLIKIGE
jgi:hypothetical protein